jgi:signal peptidase I
MKKICENCKHYKPFNCKMMGGGDTVEYNDGYDYSLARERGDRLIVSEWITVPEDFGCIHWEPKVNDKK